MSLFLALSGHIEMSAIWLLLGAKRTWVDQRHVAREAHDKNVGPIDMPRKHCAQGEVSIMIEWR
jgi:hypothetical protein